MRYQLIKNGDLFLLTDRAGNITGDSYDQYGLYTEDTRFLSRYELLINKAKPVLLSSAAEENYFKEIFLTNPDSEGIEQGKVGLIRKQLIFDNVLYDSIELKNYHYQPLEIELSFQIEADFLDIFQVRKYTSEQRLGDLLPNCLTESGILLGYSGRDNIERRTEVKVISGDAYLEEDRITFNLKLDHGSEEKIELAVIPGTAAKVTGVSNYINFERAERELMNSYQDWNNSCLQVSTDNERFNKLLERSRLDLKALMTDSGDGALPVAGIPWYAVPFGRDSIITSLQTLILQPEIARGTLKVMSRYQGQKVDGSREEEPGKIMHEIRYGELANLKKIPHTPYYGTIDATPLFIILAVEYFHWTGDLELIRKLMPALEAALAWIDQYGDRDGDGYVEYNSKTTDFTVNQGWKDSIDSSIDRNGNIVEPPVALAEVQGYVYQAKVSMAEMFSIFGRIDEAGKLKQEAEELKNRFNKDFWMPERGFFALGLDGQKKRIDSLTSNPGHCLYSGIINEDKAAGVAALLTGDELASGWGVRTMGKNEGGYNPLSYHNGSIWPHDNSIIALGLKRYNYGKEANQLVSEIFKAVRYFEDNRLPELYCGFGINESRQPVGYPVACSPQAWAAGSVFLFLQTIIGLEVDAHKQMISLNPLLPEWLNRVRIKNLQVGNSKIGFTLIKKNGKLKLVDEKIDGQVEIKQKLKKIEGSDTN